MNTNSTIIRLLLPACIILHLASCQKEEVKPSITFEAGATPEVEFSSAGGRQTISFTSSLDWTASSSASWLSLDKAAGEAGSCSITLSAAANGEFDGRTAKVTLISQSASTSLNKTVTVTQLQKDGLSVSPSAVSVSYKGGETSLSVSTNVQFSVVTGADWIAYEQTKSLSESKLYFSIAINPVKEQRSASITLVSNSGGIEAAVKVTQEANPVQTEGELTPFTINHIAPGEYSGTGGDSPLMKLSYEQYQYSYGFAQPLLYLRYVDFDEGTLTELSTRLTELKVGASCTITTKVGTNGDMTEQGARTVTLVAKSDDRLWFEDKSDGTGYIIPTE